jgi:prepilin-type N-terminal cleavage/methylation domain-containing protein
MSACAPRNPRGTVRPGRPDRDGFTLLELLVALMILVSVFAIVWSAFANTMRAWERGSELLDDLHGGDYVMELLVSSLRSSAFFSSSPGAYGFRLDDRSGRYPRDAISWVTSSAAFVPPDSPLAKGLYRVSVTVENNDDGDPSVTVRAYPHFAEEVNEDDIEPWHLSGGVKGINCRTWNVEDELWEDQWEDTNSVPRLIELTLFMDPLEKYGKPVELQRLVEIPIAPALKAGVSLQPPTDGQPGQGKQPTGTQPTGTQPTGTQPTGTSPKGTQPTGAGRPTGGAARGGEGGNILRAPAGGGPGGGAR